MGSKEYHGRNKSKLVPFGSPSVSFHLLSAVQWVRNDISETLRFNLSTLQLTFSAVLASLQCFAPSQFLARSITDDSPSVTFIFNPIHWVRIDFS